MVDAIPAQQRSMDCSQADGTARAEQPSSPWLMPSQYNKGAWIARRLMAMLAQSTRGRAVPQHQ
eukprot:54306-Pelagomonas_calceolata.AAC.9